MKLFLSIVFITATSACFGQSIKVTKETIRLKASQAKGFEVIVDGTSADVEAQLAKFLKPVGKLRKTTDASVISEPMIEGKNFVSPLYVVVRDKGKGAAWFGLDPSENKGDSTELYAAIEKLARDFAVAFYRDKVQAQIDESVRALQAVERQQQRLLNQNKDFTTRLGENKNEKIQLEKALVKNGIEYDALLKKLEQNRKDQDSVALAGEQIKKMILLHKEKQQGIN